MKKTFNIDESKFGNQECLALKKERKMEKKYNIKFNIKDLKLIEQLSQQFGCSQSLVINAVLRNWLLREFREVVAKAPDCGAAVAAVADDYAGLMSSVDVANCCSDPSFQVALAKYSCSPFSDISSFIKLGPLYGSNQDQRGYKANYTEYFDVYLKYLLDFMKKHEMDKYEIYSMLTKILKKLKSDNRNQE